MHPFTICVAERHVPGLYWLPSGPPRGLLLACHGGSGHKLSEAITNIVAQALPMGLVVVAIDGPVHGGRRSDGRLDKLSAITSFREAWKNGVGQLTMAEDMTAAVEHVQKLAQLGDLPWLYMGVSMGTAYGIPLLARDKRFVAAVIGLWSAGHVQSGHLADHAKSMAAATLFTMQWEDEVFDRQSTIALYEAVGATNKRLLAYPGPHRELEGYRLTECLAFLGEFLS